MSVKMPEKGLLGTLWNSVIGPSAGATSTEFAGTAGAAAVIAMLPIPEELKAKLLASLAAVYAVVRGIVKIVEVWKGKPSEPPTAPPAKAPPAAAALMLCVLALGAGGCASTALAPYKLSVEGMADTGDKVRPLIKTPLTPGEQALVDAWDFQREAGHRLAAGDDGKGK